MTILGPLLMAGLILAPILISSSDSEEKQIWICDESDLFASQFENTDALSYLFMTESIDLLKESFAHSEASALVHIPQSTDDNFNSLESSVTVFTHKPLSFSESRSISGNIESGIESFRLKGQGLSRELLNEIKSRVNLSTVMLSRGGGEKISSTEISTALSLIGGLLIYFFIFLYGSMVMRGVMEEKSNRIVEIIISSVKPFQLMMGKILGIALVGFTQFALWVVLTFAINSLVISVIVNPYDMNSNELVKGSNKLIDQNINNESEGVDFILDQLTTTNFNFLLLMFLFYFVGGYLMYGALFAALGSAVDSEADTQQFILPITLPLIFSIIALQTIIENPDSSLAFWCSIIPFTSPIVMMSRLPFDPPIWEVLLSMFLLVLGFIFTSWIAGRIFRVGILMYGQKVNYKTLFKWLRQS
jgi:ABC-2 type transport system permease protein